MLLAFRLALVLVGLLSWAGIYLLWHKGSRHSQILKICYYVAAPLLYTVGYFLVLIGLGIDHWDDSSDWYWDTWLLFGSAAAVSMIFALTRFRGMLRLILIVVPILFVAAVIRFYLSA